MPDITKQEAKDFLLNISKTQMPYNKTWTPFWENTNKKNPKRISKDKKIFIERPVYRFC